MIDAATRARWREMFAVATAEPWAHRYGRDVYSTLYQRPVMTSPSADDHNLAFCAEARAGWPRTLAELVAVEAERDAARIAIEHEQNATGEIALRLAAQAVSYERDRHEALLEVNKLRALWAELDAHVTKITPVIHAMDVLHAALRAWKRHRHTPNLLAALAAYEAASGG